MTAPIGLRIDEAAGRIAQLLTRNAYRLPAADETALLDEVSRLFRLADEAQAADEQRALPRPGRWGWWRIGRGRMQARLIARLDAIGHGAGR